MEYGGHLLARAGRALLRNLRGGKGSLRSTLRADPCRPGEPGVAQRVPDRGDDLTRSGLPDVAAEHGVRCSKSRTSGLVT